MFATEFSDKTKKKKKLTTDKKNDEFELNTKNKLK